MQRSIVFLLAFMLALNSILIGISRTTPQTSEPSQKPGVIHQVSNYLADGDEEEAKTVAAILNNFAGMIGNLVTIAQDPNNPIHVATNLGNLITGIGHIVAEALKKSLIEHNVAPRVRKKIIQSCEKHLITAIRKTILKHDEFTVE